MTDLHKKGGKGLWTQGSEGGFPYISYISMCHQTGLGF